MSICRYCLRVMGVSASVNRLDSMMVLHPVLPVIFILVASVMVNECSICK